MSALPWVGGVLLGAAVLVGLSAVAMGRFLRITDCPCGCGQR